MKAKPPKSGRGVGRVASPATEAWIDVADECVHIGDHRHSLPPKAYETLIYLARRPNLLVTKSELLEAIWAGTYVSDAALTVVVAQLRELLGDDSAHPTFIQTVHRRGYRLIKAIPLHAPHRSPPVVEPTAGETAAPLFGREREIEEMTAAWRRADAGQHQLLFLSGPAGIGKTTLVDTFLARPLSSFRIGRGQCVEQYGTCEGYMPILSALEELGRDSTTTHALRRVAPTWLAQMPSLSQPDERLELAQQLAAATPQRMLREWTALLAELGRGAMTVLVLEDLHWSDHATVTALAAFAQARNVGRVLVLATLRVAEAIATQHPINFLRRELLVKQLCHEQSLRLLSADEIASYLTSRFHPSSFPSDLARVLLTLTTGNPLFVRIAVDELVESGSIRRYDGKWVLDGELGAIAASIPESVRQVLEQQLARLPAPTRAILEAGSVAGIEFAAHPVAAALEADTTAVESSASSLARSGQFLSPGGTACWPDGSASSRFEFVHSLHHQVVYGRIPLAQREEWHRRIAEHMERGFSTDPSEVLGPLAIQFELARQPLRAARYRRQAAQGAMNRHAYHEAREHLQRALTLLATAPSGSERAAMELQCTAALLTPTFAVLGSGAGELADLSQRVLVMSRSQETSIEVLQALGGMLSFHLTSGRLDDGEATALEFIARAGEVPWGDVFVRVGKGQLGLFHLYQGGLESALGDLAEGTSLPNLLPLAPLELGVIFTAASATAHALMGEWRRSEQLGGEAAGRAEQTRHPPTIRFVLGILLRTALLLGDRVGVARVLQQLDSAAQALRQESGHFVPELLPGWLAVARGWIRCLDEDLDGGLEQMQAGAQESDFASRSYHPVYFAVLAEQLIRARRFEQARTVLQSSFESMAQHGERWLEAEMHRLLAEGIRTQTSPRSTRRKRASDQSEPAAETSFLRAIEVAQSQKASWYELRATVGLAQLHKAQARNAEARRILAPLCRRFDADLDLPTVQTAHRLLASL